jgi:MFS transporter, DHA1 family, inner membrane transport protein
VATPPVRLRETPRELGAIVGLALMAFLYVTTETMPIGLLPQIAHGVHASIPATGLIVSMYAATVAVVSVPLVLLTRNMDRRRLLVGILGIYVVTVLATAAAPGYWPLLSARVATALTQSVFWAIVGPTAAALFSPEQRSRVLSLVFTGSSLAIIAGTPSGTWLGQHVGWRVSFVVLAGIGLAALVAVAALVPTFDYGESHAASGVEPDVRRYVMLVVVTAVGMGGLFTMSTYVAPFLTRVVGLPKGAVSPILLAGGVAGVVGIHAAGRLMERSTRLALMAPIGLIAAALLLLFPLAHVAVLAVPLITLTSVGIAAFATTLTGRVLDVAPGSSDLASAGTSSAFNVGIGGGAALGAVVLPLWGVRSTALVGGALTAGALALLLAEPRLARAAP